MGTYGYSGVLSQAPFWCVDGKSERRLLSRGWHLEMRSLRGLRYRSKDPAMWVFCVLAFRIFLKPPMISEKVLWDPECINPAFKKSHYYRCSLTKV